MAKSASDADPTADPEVPAASDVAAEAETAAAEIGKDAVTAAAAAAAVEHTGGLTGAAEAGASAAAEAMMHDAETLLPPVEHDAWDALKGWVRHELDLMQAGHSIASRRQQNP